MKIRKRIRNDRTTEVLPFFESKKRICSKCRRNEIYLDLKNMDWCEDCINQFVTECNE